MKERPLPLNAEMVNAVQAGTKTQTRRPFNPQPFSSPDDPVEGIWWNGEAWFPYSLEKKWVVGTRKCGVGMPTRFGVPGDRLWVQETWAMSALADKYSPSEMAQKSIGQLNLITIKYKADSAVVNCASSLLPDFGRWRPSIHMPRWASRITLEVEDVWCHRIQDISENDCIAEGVPCDLVHETKGVVGKFGPLALMNFGSLWESIYAQKGHGWDQNGWVEACRFRRID